MNFKILGTTNDVTACSCCGRTNLKKTVELGLLDADNNFHGEVLHYGTDCAAAALGFTKRHGKTAVENKVLNLTTEFLKAVSGNEVLGRFVKQVSMARKDGRLDGQYSVSFWMEKLTKKAAVTEQTVKAAYGW